MCYSVLKSVSYDVIYLVSYVILLCCNYIDYGLDKDYMMKN